MAQQAQGKPALVIRLPQETIDKLKARAAELYGPPARGQSGGASRLVRALIYQELGEEPPPEFGSKNPERNRKLRERRARKSSEEKP